MAQGKNENPGTKVLSEPGIWVLVPRLVCDLNMEVAFEPWGVLSQSK